MYTYVHIYYEKNKDKPTKFLIIASMQCHKYSTDHSSLDFTFLSLKCGWKLYVKNLLFSSRFASSKEKNIPDTDFALTFELIDQFTVGTYICKLPI